MYPRDSSVYYDRVYLGDLKYSRQYSFNDLISFYDIQTANSYNSAKTLANAGTIAPYNSIVTSGPGSWKNRARINSIRLSVTEDLYKMFAYHAKETCKIKIPLTYPRGYSNLSQNAVAQPATWLTLTGQDYEVVDASWSTTYISGPFWVEDCRMTFLAGNAIIV